MHANANTARNAHSTKGVFETKSWGKTCGSKGAGKVYAARCARRDGKAEIADALADMAEESTDAE